VPPGGDYPLNVALAVGDVDENGDPTNDFVVKSCRCSTCAYYQYLQGTSMAAPHAVGVAALIVNRYGRRDASGPAADPGLVEFVLRATATKTACPSPATYVHPLVPADYTATCQGTRSDNGFYASGVVNPLSAVRRR